MDANVDIETESEARKEALAEEADARIKRGAHWEDWMFVADGFVVGRTKAMRRSGTNQPIGSAYNRCFGEWMNERPWAKAYDKATRNHLFWAADHRSEIEQWRTTLAQNVRERMNHPTTLRRAYDAAHKPASNPNAPRKETTLEAHVRENEELRTENKKLKHQIEAGDGSLFDLRRDSIEAIVNVIAGTVPLGRFESLQRSMTKKLGELKAAEKTKHAKAG
jgi:hypothetical protein